MRPTAGFCRRVARSRNQNSHCTQRSCVVGRTLLVFVAPAAFTSVLVVLPTALDGTPRGGVRSNGWPTPPLTAPPGGGRRTNGRTGNGGAARLGCNRSASGHRAGSQGVLRRGERRRIRGYRHRDGLLVQVRARTPRFLSPAACHAVIPESVPAAFSPLSSPPGRVGACRASVEGRR